MNPSTTYSVPALLIAVVASLCGCGGTVEDPRGSRVSGTGLVTLDSKPLEYGRIVFITNQGNGEVKATAMIEEGSFVFTPKTGPLEGEARVEIHPVEIELEEFEDQRQGNSQKKIDIARVPIPAKYNVNSELTADVSLATGIAPLTFKLESE